MHFSLNDYILFVMFLVSLTSFIQKPTFFYLKLFPLYIIIALIVELVEVNMARQGKTNTGIANIFGTAEFCFYLFVLREIIINVKVRRIILFFLFFYPILCFIIIYLQKQVGFSTINFSIGCLLTVVFCIYYYMELFQQAETRSLAKLPAFWIATGIFFSNVLTFPTFALMSYMKDIPKLILNNLSTIFNIISILTSILYSIGFLCRLRIRKSSL
jgi:hypothetical protein